MIATKRHSFSNKQTNRPIDDFNEFFPCETEIMAEGIGIHFGAGLIDSFIDLFASFCHVSVWPGVAAVARRWRHGRAQSAQENGSQLTAFQLNPNE